MGVVPGLHQHPACASSGEEAEEGVQIPAPQPNCTEDPSAFTRGGMLPRDLNKNTPQSGPESSLPGSPCRQTPGSGKPLSPLLANSPLSSFLHSYGYRLVQTFTPSGQQQQPPDWNLGLPLSNPRPEQRALPRRPPCRELLCICLHLSSL